MHQTLCKALLIKSSLEPKVVGGAIIPFLLRPREVKSLGQDHMAQPPTVQFLWVDSPLDWCPQNPSPQLLSVAVVTVSLVSALAIELVQNWAGKALSRVT